MVAKSLKEHPELKQNQDQLEIITQQNYNLPAEKQIYVVPVVFHIIHEYGTENISDAQVIDAIKVMNEDYSLTNSDAANIVSQFSGIAANIGFQFKLANKDPQGNCTNGIDRIVSPETFIGDDGSKLNPWPRNMYLNIWVVKNVQDAAAYAYLPGTAPSNNVDGIICRADYVGSIGTSNHTKSHTLSHETGHFFNLKHTWGNSNSPGVSCGSDNVNDTPTTMGWTSCNLSGATCSSPLDNVQNFMEYSYCSCMFTAGQKSRMVTAITSAWGSRNNLWTSSNLSATGVSGTPVICTPVADFTSSSTFVCAGSSLNFSDISYNGIVTNRTWIVNGGTASSLNDSVITVTYNTPGTYSVTLTVSNASGSDVVTKNGVVIVLPTTAAYTSGWTEDFENDVIPEADWIPHNMSTASFGISNSVHYTGSKSLSYINSASYVGLVSEVAGPTFDMTAISNPVLTFHVAFAQRTSDNTDKLRMLVSTDCGKTWAQRYYKLGTTLSTSSATTSSFYPSSQSSWRMETVPMNNYAGLTNVRIKFEFTSQGGNNLFIDDINLGGYSFADEILSAHAIQVFPNPAADEIYIQSLDGMNPEYILIADASGKILSELYPEKAIEVLNIQTYAAGIYFVKVRMIDGSVVVRKFVKE